MDIYSYTKEQYNNFGWVRANDILNEGQARDFYSKFADAVTGSARFPKTKSGEYMIAVSDIYDSDFEGVNNTIVYVKGKIESPQITRVLDIYEYEETIIDPLRRRVYDFERRGVQCQTGGVFRRYSALDYGDRYYQSRSIKKVHGDHDEFGVRRGGSGETAGGIKALHFDDEGNEVSREVQYSLKTDRAATTRKIKTDANENRKKVYTKEDVAKLAENFFVDNYTEEQYNNFGWVRANEILSAGQAKDFYSKLADALVGSARFPKTKSGEYMIAVSDIYDSDFEGVNNTIVYVKGKIESPQITRVLDIIEYEETIIDKERRLVYSAERRGIQPTDRGVFRFYYAFNYGFDEYWQRIRAEGSGDYSELEVRRGGSGETAGGIKALHFDDEGNEVSREARAEYSNGVADHIAIEYENKVYIVDSGKEKGVISFGVRKKLTISNDVKRSLYIKKNNKEAYENGYGSRDVFEKIGVELDVDHGSDVGQERKKDAKAAGEKSQHNEGRVPEKNENRGVDEAQLQYSLKPHGQIPAARKTADSAKKQREYQEAVDLNLLNFVDSIKSDNGQVLNVESKDSPQPTSETLLDGIAANDSICEKSKIVKGNNKNNLGSVSYSLKQHVPTDEESVCLGRKA